MEERPIVFDKPLIIVKEEIEKHKNFILYQVYGVRDDKKYPLYKTCGNGR